jgi:lipopolysaccharide export system protein LptA
MKSKAKTFLIAMLTVTPLVVPMSVRATGTDMTGAAAGPIDIRANEQEFAENQVIAKGNVKVTYKDSIVYAPLATLFRDAGGNPQRAVFTGHPHLTQGANKIDADQLTFEMANAKIVATGHAHSEVISEAKPEEKNADGSVKATGGIENPTADLTKELGGGKSTAAKGPDAKPEKIVTDSDRQEYDRNSGKFEAIGNVRVQHGEILVHSDKLQLIYGLDGRPEAAVFLGNVNALQGKNSTIADNMTYTLATKRLQATGHVKSTVIQEQKPGAPAKKNTIGLKDPVGMPAANAATTGGDEPKEDVVLITSDSQDYSRETGRMTANGNVRVFYQNIIGAGPTAILVRNAQGKTERVVFSGRSQISQPGRRWIADRIEMTMDDKKVIATGNTKALILQAPGQKGAPQPAPQMQLAKRNTPNQQLSATKVDPTR